MVLSVSFTLMLLCPHTEKMLYPPFQSGQNVLDRELVLKHVFGLAPGLSFRQLEFVRNCSVCTITCVRAYRLPLQASAKAK